MSFLKPDVSDIKDFYKRGHYLLAWRICVAFTIIFVFLGVLYGVANPIGLIPVIAVLSVALFGFYYLKKTKKVRAVFWIFAIGGSIISNFAMNTMYDYTHYVDFLWLTCCILVAFIGLGKKEGVLFIVINSIGIGIFFFVSLNKHIELLPQRTLIELIGDFIEVLFAFSVIAYLLKQFISMQKHAEKKLLEVNEDLEIQNSLFQAKSNENEILIKEIHHRVKNNLQIIVSLLRMQSQEMKTEEGREHFKEAINRIMTMSLIHEKLYAEKELSNIDLQSYIEELTQEIINVYSINENVNLTILTDIEKININTIVPIGLLINELVSNSLKHGLKDVANGEISINISKIANQYQFSYCDNGTWKESPEGRFSFGVELIDILTEQMNGEKSLNTDNGTCYLFILNDV
ncbi:MAG: sensor histidine kinase [Fluviicola sp.]|nr:sensor histidine kinase [Fluviicola sp.]